MHKMMFPSESSNSVSKGSFREFRPFSVIAENHWPYICTHLHTLSPSFRHRQYFPSLSLPHTERHTHTDTQTHTLLHHHASPCTLLPITARARVSVKLLLSLRGKRGVGPLNRPDQSLSQSRLHSHADTQEEDGSKDRIYTPKDRYYSDILC